MNAAEPADPAARREDVEGYWEEPVEDLIDDVDTDDEDVVLDEFAGILDCTLSTV